MNTHQDIDRFLDELENKREHRQERSIEELDAYLNRREKNGHVHYLFTSDQAIDKIQSEK